MEVIVFRAEQNDGAIAVTPYPFDAYPPDAAWRMQEVANTSGVDIAGVVRSENGSVFPNWRLRRQLRRQDFDDYNQAVAEQVSPQLGDYEQILAWGDSNAACLAGSLVLSRTIPFTHALFRDPIHFNPPQSTFAGHTDYLAYRLAKRIDDYHSSRGLRPTESPKTHGLRQLIHSMAELATYGPMWWSEHSQRNLRDIASGMPQLPLQVASLGDSFADPSGLAARFGHSLQSLRKTAHIHPRATVRLEHLANWEREDLLRNNKQTAAQIHYALTLNSYVTMA